MSIHNERLAAMAASKAHLIAELFELNQLRDRFRKAQLSAGRSRRTTRQNRARRPQLDQPAFTLSLMLSDGASANDQTL
jgi:hypothetical protein